MAVVQIKRVPRVPRAQELLQNTGSNFLGLWTPEQNVKNLGASGHDGTLVGASIVQGELGPCINGTNYRITCASGDGDDIASDWNTPTSTIVIVGRDFAGTCWVRGDNADYLYYHGSVITYISPSDSYLGVYTYDKVLSEARLSDKGHTSASGPIAVGFIAVPWAGTCYVASRGRYSSVVSNNINLNNDGICQWHFGSYFLDWGGAGARPTGELYGWMTWSRAMSIGEMLARLDPIQRALDGRM